MLKKDSAFFLNYMPTGFFGNPNNLAITLNMTLPFFLLQRNITYKIIVPLLILVIIWYTNSRGCLAAYLLTLILYVFLVDIKKTILGFFILLWVVLIILLYEPFLNLIINFLDPFKQYLTFEGLNNSNSDGKRLNYILKGWESIQNNFFLGIGGYGSFVILNGASMHNIWVEMIVDIGVIGFSIFIFWYMIIIIKIYMIAIFSADKVMRYYSQSIFISISVFLFSSISASSVIYHLPTWILFGFAVSIINIDKSSKSK
ncbi:MAG: O-antigen ligase family protein [Alphaproteobacteria bacterium]|nr:O-antigen ligase family protein [Alphaproteobacteria bacterium]